MYLKPEPPTWYSQTPPPSHAASCRSPVSHLPTPAAPESPATPPAPALVKYILIHGDHEKKMKHFRKNSRKKIYFFLLLHQDKHTLNILKTKLKISQKNA